MCFASGLEHWFQQRLRCAMILEHWFPKRLWFARCLEHGFPKRVCFARCLQHRFQQTALFCEVFGAQVPRKAVFCEAFGALVPKHALFCETFGAHVSKQAMFCEVCITFLHKTDYVRGELRDPPRNPLKHFLLNCHDSACQIPLGPSSRIAQVSGLFEEGGEEEEARQTALESV